LGFWGDGFGTDYLREIPSMGKLICIVLYSLLLLIAIAGAVPSVGLGVVTSPAFIALSVFVGIGIANAFLYEDDIIDQFSYDNSCHKGAIQLYGTGQKSNLSIIRLQPNRPINHARVIEDMPANIQKNPKYNKPNIDWVNQWQTGYQKLNVFNYDLYFDSYYLGNLYPELHEATDNYQFRNSNNSLREITLVACCNYLQFFGFDNENNRKEGRVIQWTYKGITYKGQVKEVIKKEYELTIKVKEFR
jgi:hypothetical protein